MTKPSKKEACDCRPVEYVKAREKATAEGGSMEAVCLDIPFDQSILWLNL